MIELEYTANRFERLKLDLIKYPAGEIGYRLPYDEPVNHIVVTPEIRGDKAIYKTSLLEDVMAAKMLSDHFPEAHVTFTYLPCSREDRRVSPIASYGLESIRRMFQFSRVTTIDQHSDEETFDNNISPRAIVNAIEDFTPSVLAFPDAGAKSRYMGRLSQMYHRGEHVIIYGDKVRNTLTGEISRYEVIGDLPAIENSYYNNSVLVIDDICDGGRTFIELAKVLKAKQSDVSLALYVTHGIFSKGLDELKTYYDKIYTTNTIITDYTEKDLNIFNWRAL
jgi:ribose-phosphate pyrophosphokinase